MLPSKSREHRMRVLENQARIAAERTGPAEGVADPQKRMPLLVEVKSSPPKQRSRRTRDRPKTDQADFGDL
jgi:hypothetical protein